MRRTTLRIRCAIVWILVSTASVSAPLHHSWFRTRCGDSFVIYYDFYLFLCISSTNFLTVNADGRLLEHNYPFTISSILMICTLQLMSYRHCESISISTNLHVIVTREWSLRPFKKNICLPCSIWQWVCRQYRDWPKQSFVLLNTYIVQEG